MTKSWSFFSLIVIKKVSADAPTAGQLYEQHGQNTLSVNKTQCPQFTSTVQLLAFTHFTISLQGHRGHNIGPIWSIMPAVHIIWFTGHYFKSPIKLPTQMSLKPPTKKTRGEYCGATRILATRGSSESNTRSMRVPFFFFFSKQQGCPPARGRNDLFRSH